MWRYTALLTVVVLTACTQLPLVELIQLTSGLEYTPTSPEVLANYPVVQAEIAACKSQGGDHCGEIPVPLDTRTKFVQGVDDKAVVLVTLTRLAPDRVHTVRFRVLDSGENMVMRTAYSYHVPSRFPPDGDLNFHVNIPLTTAQPGQWRVEIAVNDQVIETLSFDVVGQK